MGSPGKQKYPAVTSSLSPTDLERYERLGEALYGKILAANPPGKALSPEELRRIAALCAPSGVK